MSGVHVRLNLFEKLVRNCAIRRLMNEKQSATPSSLKDASAWRNGQGTLIRPKKPRPRVKAGQSILNGAARSRFSYAFRELG